jgi:PAS domain S-box-containing protein
MNKDTILLLGQAGRSQKSVLANLKSLNLHAVVAETANQGLRKLHDWHPDMVIIDIDMPEGVFILQKIRSQHPDMQIMVLSAAARLTRNMADLKYVASEFVSMPLNPDAFEIALNRMQRMTQLNRRLQNPEKDTQPVFSLETNQHIESERFVTVRQIIDRISIIIGRLADDVQGGVRYFAEMPYFVSIHDRDCKVLAVNSAYRKYLGNKLYGNSWDIYQGEHRQREACPACRTLIAGQVMTTHAIVRYLNGAEVPVIVHTSPIYNNDGEVELVLEVFAGTKDIDRMSEEIITTQQRYHQLFDEVPCYIAAVDRKMRVAAVNRRFKEAFGDQTGRTFYEIFNHVSVPVGTCSITHTIKDGLAHHSEMVLISRAGKQFNMLTWTKPIVTSAGKLLQVLVIFIDITELRQTQENLASLGLMLSTLSHNLKGILTGLDAGLYFIEKGFYRNQNARIEEGLDVSKLMAERIRRMVYDILYYARERDLKISLTDVANFVNDVVALIGTRIRAANIDFTCRVAAEIGEFEIDTGLFRSALLNLLENAMEACIEDAHKPAHKIELTVKADNGNVLFNISDNGSGIEKDLMPHMFTLFYSSKGHKGTGLGLFITWQVVRKHGGHISATSEKNKGTHFHIRMPRKAGVEKINLVS